ncbi:alpha-amylase family glycosyl hydrolase [Paraflavitalea pollutisoli]|uniref:alpha-amylase family glycosyl hydrolase n=1 Tax=Paraflavitalea pollutisoli TaxID=3034143 RepID=UPI0023ED0A00|nr:alpha-amylase family glycosyl hydrolase [Paraflavitalea sp. H1-2-19X]
MLRRFTPIAWSTDTNIYEVNIRQYTTEGTFQAFAQHLPRLADMGVEVLWFMPITPISVAGRKGTMGSYYACSDYTTTNAEFGTVADFKQLVQQAHEAGMKVIVDWVANHTGLDHVWTKTHPEYFKKDIDGKFYDTHGWDDVIDLNYYDQPMRQAMIDAMIFWVKECNIDGFRCDMAHLVPLDFWRQARTALDQVKTLFWLAETEDIPYLDVFDTCYAWRWMHHTEKFSKGQLTLQALVDLLGLYRQQYPSGTCPLFFTANHDENSWNGTEYEKYDGAVRPLAVFNATWFGIPLIYSGQELPNLKRLKFFDKDPIEWTGTFQLHSFYQTLNRLRKQHPAINTSKDTQPILLSSTEPDKVFFFMRQYEQRRLVVLLNFTAQPISLQLMDERATGIFINIFDHKTYSLALRQTIELQPWEYLVLNDQ